jgi:hypothetical protein
MIIFCLIARPASSLTFLETRCLESLLAGTVRAPDCQLELGLELGLELELELELDFET